MVKADPKCDYYADLELPPSAEANEIKRQFKKLGLIGLIQDRNPGKELEFNSKFQAIQAAHEVLTDPAQRARYDADRRKNGLSPSYSSPLRPNPPPRAAASNFPPPPQRTPQAPNRTSFNPQSSSGASRYSAYMRADPNNSYKSPADDAKARANAFKAWEQMRHGQGVPPQARPVPPRPTNNPAFQPSREAGSFPPQDQPQRTPWDQTKEPHAGFPKMARSNTTRVPKKGGFAPGFSAGDEPPARNTSAYFNVSSKGEKADTSRSNFESRPVPPPPPASSNQRSSQKQRPDPLKPFRPQSATEDILANNERLSTPYATSGGEKTYFSTGFSRPTSARDGTSGGDLYDSEPPNRSPNPASASAASHRAHHSASPKMRGPRPVSISSTSSSSDESLREGVEQLYTSAGQPHGSQHRSPNGHLRPSYKPFIGPGDMGGDKHPHPRSRSDAIESTSKPGQKPQSTSSNHDPSQTEGFMEHRMKHEAERTHGTQASTFSGPYASDTSRPQQRPLHRPKSWHDKYGEAGQDQTKNNPGRPATGGQPAKSSMYDAGFGPNFLAPSSQSWCRQWPFGGSRTSTTARRPSTPLPNWAIPSCIPPSGGKIAKQPSHPYSSSTLPIVDNADNIALDSFSFPPETQAPRAHPPPLRSHSSDTISVNFSPSDWNGKFTGKPGEYFDPQRRKSNASRGRLSPTKRQAPTPTQAQSIPPVEGPELANGSSQMPPPPPPQGSSHEEMYSPDKWAPYFKPGTLHWPPPPPPSGAPARGGSRKRPVTPSRRLSKTTKRPAVPKPASVAPAVDITDKEAASSALGSGSSQDFGNGTPMDLDPGNSPPNGADAASIGRASNHVDVRDSTPRPPIPPRATVPPRKPTPQDSQLGLGDFKNVAPFAPNQEGIKNLDDLGTALPFESQASRQPTKPPSPQRLALPQPPKPPEAPQVLTQSSWEHYIAAMRSYMAAWNAFNTQMLAHFNERQASNESASAGDWISAVGVGTEKWGYAKYMQGVEEDFTVRAHWEVSWEKHRECMRALGVVRERLLGTPNRAVG
ncbi:MAG: hypothetical protein Q9168_001957 [Polycauliona sp. 1 TL-2023]